MNTDRLHNTDKLHKFLLPSYWKMAQLNHGQPWSKNMKCSMKYFIIIIYTLSEIVQYDW